jgi:ABC-type glycerol-3-phosphate transport system substrate-binding protein
MDERKRLARRDVLRGGLAAAGLAVSTGLTACGATATPQVVEKEVTRVVAGTPEVVTETVVVKETVVVEQTVLATAAASTGPVTISLLMVDWNDDCRKLYDETILPKFQELNPGWTVAADYTGWGDLDVKVMTAFAGGLQPDLFQADNVEFGPKYNQKGIIAELNPLIDADTDARAKVDDFYPKALYEGATINGQIVALPYVLDNRALFYRKDFLKEVGLPDTAPQNWDEFRDAAIKQTKMDGDVFVRAGWHAGVGQFCFQNYVPLLWQNGGELLDDAHSRCAFNSDAGVEALAFWARLIIEDKVGPVEDMPAVGDMSPYVAGTQAMAFSSYGELINAQKYAPDIWDSIGITVLGQKQPAALWYANTFFLSKGRRLSEAWKLLSYLVLDDDNFRQYHEATGGLPPRQSVAAAAKHMTPLHLMLINDVMAAAGSHTTPAEPFNAEVLERVTEACQSAVYGTATAKEALDKAAQEGDQIIARYAGA